jgi:hypothetical protein
MAKELGSIYKLGRIPFTHPENFIVIDNGEDLVITDFSDMFEVSSFPRSVEGDEITLAFAIKKSLSAIDEIYADPSSHDRVKNLKEGLSEGLFGKDDTNSQKKRLLELTTIEEIIDFLKETLVPLQKTGDQAAMGTRGGIDFTANKTPLEIQNSGKGIDFKMDPAMLEQLRNAPGFTPVIIDIQPLIDLRGFLGLKVSEKEAVLAKG